MRDRRNTSPLLPKKLLALREFLTVDQVELAASLNADILSQSGHPHKIKPKRISQYEEGLYEPNFLVLVAYSRVGRVHLDLIADDRFTLQEFQKQLGKHTR